MELQVDATRKKLTGIETFLDYLKTLETILDQVSLVFFGVELPFVIESGKYILHKHYLGSK